MKPQEELDIGRRAADAPRPRKDLDYHKYKVEKNIESIEEHARNPSKTALAIEFYNKQLKEEKAARMAGSGVDAGANIVVSDAKSNAHYSPDYNLPKSDIVVVKDPSSIRSTNAAFDPRFANSSKLPAGGAAVPVMGNQFTNPADVVKAGYNKFVQPVIDDYVAPAYNKFEAARKSVVDKVVDLTDMTAHNPHVPQYAKDTYNKAATALVNNAADPLNAIGGAGAVDAVMGLGGAAYELYSSNRKPASTPVDNRPLTNPAIKINWGNKP